MNVKVEYESTPIRHIAVQCPKCGKLMKPKWFGYRCSRCNYEQLNKDGREFNEIMNWKEIE